ncbi:hypothetical protein [Vulcanisaeta thermophila]|uniref:hypothetical protein n=1 Tax=Vulcanisaeta thermophila TaxID=867917 RepID=UPI000852B61D|nr:hypothetical protein [Vulcanisaeta thermophila]
MIISREKDNEELRGIQGIIKDYLRVKRMDDFVKRILSYIIMRGSVTLYRVAVDLGMNFSTVYKKANYMVEEGLIRKARFKPTSYRYESTIKGLLSCVAYECADYNYVVSALKRKWGLPQLRDEDVAALLHVLTSFITRNNFSLELLEMPLNTVFLLYNSCGSDIYKCLLSYGVSNDVASRISNVFAYYMVRFMRNLVGEWGYFVETDKYQVLIDSKGFVIAALCTLCGSTRYCTGEFVCSKLYDNLQGIIKRVKTIRINNSKLDLKPDNEPWW